MKKDRYYGSALQAVTFRAVLRRGSSLLLAAVVMAGVLSSMVLHQLTIRQEAALSDTIANTNIRCVITDQQGMNMDNLGMQSLFVDMLAGKRHERGCYLDEAVKNIRAWASYPLKYPEDTVLHFITAPDASSLLSAVNGVTISFAEGWDESAFFTEEPVCLVSEYMMTFQENGEAYVLLQMEEQEKMQLKVIGTFSGGSVNDVFCPFYMPWPDGLSHSFSVKSCSFDILDNRKLEESKELLYTYFTEPKLTNPIGGIEYGLMVQDEVFLKTVEEIRSNISMLHLLLPVLTILCCAIGFFSSSLAIRSRNREFAVMRCLGMKRIAVFALVFEEQAVLALCGAVVGLCGGLLLVRQLDGMALLKAAGTVFMFLAGAAAAVLHITGQNVMSLMKTEE